MRLSYFPARNVLLARMNAPRAEFYPAGDGSPWTIWPRAWSAPPSWRPCAPIDATHLFQHVAYAWLGAPP